MEVLSKRDKEKLKNDIDKYKYLKILSFEEDLVQRKRLIYDESKKSLFIATLILYLFILLSFIIRPERMSSTSEKTSFGVIGLGLILLAVHFVVDYFNKKIIKINRYIFIIIPFEFFLLFSLLWGLSYTKNGDWIYDNCKLNGTIFILSVLFTGFQFWKLIKHFPNYLIKSLNTIIFTLLAISSIVTLVWSPNIIKPENMIELFVSWGIILIIGAVTVIQICFEHKRFKNEEMVQQIFQEQLLLNAPDYKKLKKCYFYGGEKYKERLLSTEKFLEVVVKNELKSLKDLKTYDDYRLYKAYKGRSYLQITSSPSPKTISPSHQIF